MNAPMACNHLNEVFVTCTLLVWSFILFQMWLCLVFKKEIIIPFIHSIQELYHIIYVVPSHLIQDNNTTCMWRMTQGSVMGSYFFLSHRVA